MNQAARILVPALFMGIAAASMVAEFFGEPAKEPGQRGCVAGCAIIVICGLAIVLFGMVL